MNEDLRKVIDIRTARIRVPAFVRNGASTLLPMGFVCLIVVSSARAQVTFQGLGPFVGLGSEATDVSADGTVVVGTVPSTEPNPNNVFSVFRWSAEDGAKFRPVTAFTRPAISADGQVVVGQYSPNFPFRFEAFRWTADGSFQALGDLPGGQFRSHAADVSADGSVVVGIGTSSNDEAFRWTQSTGMVGLGDLPSGRFESEAFGTSANGAVVVGYGFGADDRQEAFRWTDETGMVGLGFLPHGIARSIATAVSADGSTVVGNNSLPGTLTGPGGEEAFRWTQSEGMIGLGDLPGGLVHSIALDVSGDGSAVVGYSAVANFGTNAFWWSAETGMLNLNDILTSSGVNLDDWILIEAHSVSYDGRTIVGWGGHNGRTEAWIATIPEPPTSLLFGAALAGATIFGLKQRRYSKLK